MQHTASDPIDYSPLRRPISRIDKQAFKAAAQQGDPDSQKLPLQTYVIFWGMLASPFIGIIFLTLLSGADAVTIVGIISFVVLLAVGLFISLVMSHRRALRLFLFAQQNGFAYTQMEIAPTKPGMIFSAGGGHRSENVINGESQGLWPQFELGAHTYSTGSRKNRRTHSWNYLCLTLDRSLPHMVLDAKANNIGLFGTTNLPAMFQPDQRLSLEGDFNEYFTLYAPKEYEQDALYIFTPDLMALMIDHGAQFDAEIVDDRIYFYTKQGKLWDPEVLSRLLALRENIGAKLARKSERYRDEQQPLVAGEVKSVAIAGRRLKRSKVGLIFTIIFIVIIVIIQLWPYISELF